MKKVAEFITANSNEQQISEIAISKIKKMISDNKLKVQHTENVKKPNYGAGIIFTIDTDDEDAIKKIKKQLKTFHTDSQHVINFHPIGKGFTFSYMNHNLV